MANIHVLAEAVKKQIAAGEVVEGPFSVVKELLENSIDAGASRCEIEVLEAGLKKIVVKDNGSGMLKEDLPLAITEHATSKIENINDISQIVSFGFRGEALSSVAAISKTTILSRHADEEIGGKIVASEGTYEITDYAGAVGTTIMVENLFYNTPARKKFLKSPGAEMRKIRETVTKIALVHPEIEFILTNNGRKQFSLAPTNEIITRIEQLYSKEFAHHLYPGELSDLRVSMTGFVSDPTFVKSRRDYQFLFVNGRAIDYKNLNFHLCRAYEAMIPKGNFPVAFIFLNINPDLIDVNIHPAKREIKFFDDRYINSMIKSFADKCLAFRSHKITENVFKPLENKIVSDEQTVDFDFVTAQTTVSANEDNFLAEAKNISLANLASEESDSLSAGDFFIEENDVDSNSKENDFLAKGSQINENLANSIVHEGNALYQNRIVDSPKQSLADFIFKGIAFKTYIIYEKDSSLYFIDFHAAHERILYDKIMSKNVDSGAQRLMFPYEIELSIDDYNLVAENLDFFRETGIEIDTFSENSLLVRSVPVFARKVNWENLVKEIIERLKDEENHLDKVRKQISASLACHSAFRAGDDLPDRDAVQLISQVLSGKYELRCPHGRPFVYEFAKSDLERLFKR